MEKQTYCPVRNENLTPAQAMQCDRIYYHKTLCDATNSYCVVLFNRQSRNLQHKFSPELSSTNLIENPSCKGDPIIVHNRDD